jgi:flagellar basal body-associated protein FliL
MSRTRMIVVMIVVVMAAAVLFYMYGKNKMISAVTLDKPVVVSKATEEMASKPAEPEFKTPADIPTVGGYSTSGANIAINTRDGRNKPVDVRGIPPAVPIDPSKQPMWNLSPNSLPQGLTDADYSYQTN